MKKIILVTVILLLTTVLFGQSANIPTLPTSQTISPPVDSVYVVKEIDEMSGKTYLYGNRSFICSNIDKTTGFRVSTYIDENLKFKFLTVSTVGIGTCSENDEIIILFENGERITKKSWNGFDCDGDSYFNLTYGEVLLLKSQPLSKIRMTNGRSYESYTGDVKDTDKRYFIQLFYSIDNRLIWDLH